MFSPEQLLRSVWTASWQAAVIALLVAGVQLLLGAKLAPSWRYGLWFLVTARLLLPSLPESPVSIFQVAPDPDFAEAVFFAGPAESESPPEKETTGTGAGVLSAPAAPVFRWPSAVQISFGIWAAGIVLVGAAMLGAHARFLRRARRGSVKPSAEIGMLVAEAAARMRLRRCPEIVETRAATAPAVFGVMRPKILLPAGVAERFSVEEFRQMLLHEFAHVKRGDLVVLAFTRALLALHWFNPVLWLAFRRMRADCELACDARVLGMQERDERIAYGRTLLRAAEEFRDTRPAAGALGMTDSGQLARRLRQVARFAKTTWGATILGAAVVGILAAITLTGEGDRQKKRDRQFYEAITHGDVEKVRGLLRSGMSPNRKMQLWHQTRGDSGYDESCTPLEAALSYSQMDVAEVLKEAGANVHQRDDIGQSLAFRAGSDPEKLQTLIDWGVDVKTPDRFGGTVLHNAARGGPDDDSETELRKWERRDPELKKRRQDLIDKQKRAIDFLLAQGLSLEARTGKYQPRGLWWSGVTPFLEAVFYRQTPEVIEHLLDLGADIDAADANGRTALIRALEISIPNSGKPEIVDLLLDRGADVNAGADNPLLNASPNAWAQDVPSPLKAAITMTRKTPWGWVTLEDSRRCTRKLLDRGARFACAPASDADRMLRAATLGDAGQVRELLNAGISPDIADDRGWTPLMSSAAQGYFDISRLLIDAGANANAVNANGDVALRYAAKSQPGSEHAKYLLAHTELKSPEATLELMRTAAVQGDADLLRKLIQNDPSRKKTIAADFHAKTSPRLILESAMDAGQFECALILVQAGMTVNLQPRGRENRTPLYRAIKAGDVELTEALLKSGAWRDFRTDAGETLETLRQEAADPRMHAVLDRALDEK